MSLAPGALAMITVAVTQKQGLEAIAAPAQIIDRIGSRPAQVANGLVGRFRNVDGFEFAGTEQSSKFHRVTAVGLYPLAQWAQEFDRRRRPCLCDRAARNR